MTQYWVTIITIKNFEINRENNFAVAGYKERLKKLCNKIEVGDKLIFYITLLHMFGAIFTVTSPLYIKRTPHWSEAGEVWPCRINIIPDLVLPKENMLDVKPLIPFLSFISINQKTSGRWGTAFMASLRRIPKQDFDLIESEMKNNCR